MKDNIELPPDLKISMQDWVDKVFEILETEKVPVELYPAVMLNALYNFQAKLIQHRVASGKVMPNVAIQMEIKNTKLFFSEAEKRLNLVLSKCAPIAPNIH